jgi:hypothetical protein
MNKKIVGVIILGIVLVCFGAFYMGVEYSKKIAPAISNNSETSKDENTYNKTIKKDLGVKGTVIVGEIIKKDENSVTVQTSDGGSKIIYLEGETNLSKNTPILFSDLALKDNIVVNGLINSDNTIKARDIQLKVSNSTIK